MAITEIKPSTRFATQTVRIGRSGYSPKPFTAKSLIIGEREDNVVGAGYASDLFYDLQGQFVPGNMYNKDTCTDGYYFNSSGVATSQAGYSISDYIPVVAGTYIAANASLTNAGSIYCCFYSDNAGTFISSIANSTIRANAQAVPANATFMRVSVATSTKNALIIARAKAGDTYTQAALVNSAYNPLMLGNKSANGAIGNVRNYGAIGNGISDDTAAFTAALADTTIKTLFIPDGIYYLSGITIADASPKSIVGESKYGTVLRLITAATTPLITLASGVNDVEIVNLTLQHVSTGFTPASGMAGQDGNLIYMAGSNYNVGINRVRFYEFTNCAININGNTDPRTTRISQCEFVSSNKQLPAIYLHGAAEYCQIMNNEFSSISGALYATYTSAGTQAKNNLFQGNICIGCGTATYPVVYCEAMRLSIVGNTINHTTGDSIKLIGNPVMSGHVISGNTIVADGSPVVSGHAGIRLLGIEKSVVTNNYVYRDLAQTTLIIDANGAVASAAIVIVANQFIGTAPAIAGSGHVHEHNQESAS